MAVTKNIGSKRHSSWKTLPGLGGSWSMGHSAASTNRSCRSQPRQLCATDQGALTGRKAPQSKFHSFPPLSGAATAASPIAIPLFRGLSREAKSKPTGARLELLIHPDVISSSPSADESRIPRRSNCRIVRPGGAWRLFPGRASFRSETGIELDSTIAHK
jgi:hypothetical protein